MRPACSAAAALGACGRPWSRRVCEAAFSDLRTATLFGDFAIDRVTRRQIGHKVLLVQWHGAQKVVIHPDAHADPEALEIPRDCACCWLRYPTCTSNYAANRNDEEDRTQD